MAEFSVAHRAALAQLLDTVPDRTLKPLTRAAAGLDDVGADALRDLLAAETVDRARRAYAFGPLTPLFHPRADGVASVVFPAGVLPRLWRAACSGERDLLPILDSRDAREAGRAEMVCARLCLAAAAAARDQGETIWPVGWGEAEAREAGLAELARCFDLALLARRAVPLLSAWIGRPDDEQTVELRLLLRDATAVAPDGPRRLVEILSGHLADAAAVLRLVALCAKGAAHETFLAESEFAVFVDRLIVAVEQRVAVIAAYRPAAGPDQVEPLRDGAAWAAAVLTELDMSIALKPDGPWGKQVRDVRARINRILSDRLSGVDRAVDRLLPTLRVQTAGRMTRVAPRLDQPIPADLLETARGGLALVRGVRSAAAVFGCEQQRRSLMDQLRERLGVYADGALDAVNAGEWPDETPALERIAMVADLLDMIEAGDAARTVRRRAAVAGASRDVFPGARVSPRAA